MLLICDCGKLYSTLVVLTNVFAPTIDDIGFFEQAVGGNLNCWLDPALDWPSTNPGIVRRSLLYSGFSHGLWCLWCMALSTSILSLDPFFQLIDTVISLYLWQGKRPCLNKTHLQKTKVTGGLALSNSCFYYGAANLRCLTFWSYCFSHLDCPDSVAMELRSTNNW